MTTTNRRLIEDWLPIEGNPRLRPSARAALWPGTRRLTNCTFGGRGVRWLPAGRRWARRCWTPTPTAAGSSGPSAPPIAWWTSADGWTKSRLPGSGPTYPSATSAPSPTTLPPPSASGSAAAWPWPTRWCWTSLPGAAASPSRPGGFGLRSIANELNPVATLILRATCQWPQKYGPALRDAYAQVSRKYLQRVRELISDNEVYPPEPQ